MKTRLLILSFAVLCLCGSPAMAALFGDGGAALQGVLDGITVGGPSSVNVATDELVDTQSLGWPYDSDWAVGGAGGSISTVIVELASFGASNTFGVYDTANPTNSVELFTGAATTGSQVILSRLADGSVLVTFGDNGIDFADNMFGFYLDATVGNSNSAAVFHSDTSLNTDGVDHMYAYQGVGDTVQIFPFAAGTWASNEYVLAFEDIYGGGDMDFTDFVVMVESVTPVPVPAAVLLGMIGLGVAGLKLRKRA